MTDWTPSQTAAAFHGLAINPTTHPHQRLSFALQALDLYEAELERLRAERDEAYGQGRDDEAAGLPLRYSPTPSRSPSTESETPDD